MNITPVKEVKVGLDFGEREIPLGRLASRDLTIFFQYDPEFLKRGLNVSPLRLPLQQGVESFDAGLFDGLPGLFNDSLPDGWGRLLFDRSVRAQGYLPEELSPLDRLVHVGGAGMGALTYAPDYSEEKQQSDLDLDWLANQANEVLEGEADEVLEELLALNGSSAGARPKAQIGFDPKSGRIVHGTQTMEGGFEPWLVKFANTQDGIDAGAIEHVYAEMAKLAGLEMMETHLFSAKTGPGYFATRRFDRLGSKRLHMHTVSGLLHQNFRIPSLDYQDLLKLTGHLTRDVREIEKMYRIAVFNVLSHNRDDHSKNFTFLMDKSGEWKVSPAYDLTFSSGPGGQQSMLVMGVGKAPQHSHLNELGKAFDIKQQTINAIIDKTREALTVWKELAQDYGVSTSNQRLINSRINP
ncbi:type II toxin-antitoxin system HipA family toxin [Hellea sp.]|nr:type II toxin-antitoxin system HipA family toxin [Hellea sp.]